jgi:hypothetical protein
MSNEVGMDRTNHYEAAFEAYLQARRLCYVAVDETRRAIFGDAPLKSLDFIVYGEGDARLLVDVKGRRFPTGPRHRLRRVWESWSTREDVQGLEQWMRLFGPGYQGLLVFAYHVLPVVALPDETEDLWLWRGRRYLFRAVAVEEYHQSMRVRSPKWGTVSLPGAAFRQMVKPFQAFTRGAQTVVGECPF